MAKQSQMSNKLATKPQSNGELAQRSDLPAFLQVRNRAVMGLDNVEHEDLVLPRLGLSQSRNLTPQMQQESPKFIKGLRDGVYFNSVTGDVYGESLQICPLHFFKSRLLFHPRGSELRGILCQAPDAKHGIGTPGGLCASCSLSQFDGVKPPQCQLLHNFACLVVPKDGRFALDKLIVVSFKSTEIGTSKQWLQQMRLSGLDSFARIYDASVVTMKNQKGTWFAKSIRLAEKELVTEEQYNIARRALEGVQQLVAAGKLIVDQDEVGAAKVEETEERTITI